jgi:plasmid stabilization system protein ParE
VTEPDPVVYSRQASETLDKIEADPEASHLWNALCDALDLIIDHPDSAQARRAALRTAAGTTVWYVTVRAPRETDDWMVLWQHNEADQILIAYIGTL